MLRGVLFVPIGWERQRPEERERRLNPNGSVKRRQAPAPLGAKTITTPEALNRS